MFKLKFEVKFTSGALKDLCIPKEITFNHKESAQSYVKVVAKKRIVDEKIYGMFELH